MHRKLQCNLIVQFERTGVDSGEEHAMNAAYHSINWLFDRHPGIDHGRAVRSSTGFRCWADHCAQSVSLVASGVGQMNAGQYLVSVRTEFLHDLDLDSRRLAALNALVMTLPSMAGPVYDPRRRSLDLCSLVRVSADSKSWMDPLARVAAVTQLAEVQSIAGNVARALEARVAVSSHPLNGTHRHHPDRTLATFDDYVEPLGRHACRWSAEEFTRLTRQHEPGREVQAVRNGDLGVTLAFPYGEQVSLCQMNGDKPHPRFGNGLMIRQSFPACYENAAEGIQLALALNARELAINPAMLGLGSYSYRDGSMYFSCFLPEAAYQAGLMRWLVVACRHRAGEMSKCLKSDGWKANGANPGTALSTH